MDNHSISTNEASKQLQKDLGLHYGLGRNVVSQFFNLTLQSTMGNYWEPKENYQMLIGENESFDFVKNRIKSKINKFWFRGVDEKNENFDGIQNLIPEKEDRRSLYIKAIKLKEDRGGRKIPNSIMLQFLITELGHYDQGHRGTHW